MVFHCGFFDVLEGSVRQIDDVMSAQACRFQFNIDQNSVSCQLQDFPEGRDLFSGVGRAEPRTRIESFRENSSSV